MSEQKKRDDRMDDHCPLRTIKRHKAELDYDTDKDINENLRQQYLNEEVTHREERNSRYNS